MIFGPHSLIGVVWVRLSTVGSEIRSDAYGS